MREVEIKQVSDALPSGQSLPVLGDPGSSKSTLAIAVEQRLDSERWSVAIAHYNGAAKECLIAIAEQWISDMWLNLADGKLSNRQAHLDARPLPSRN